VYMRTECETEHRRQANTCADKSRTHRLHAIVKRERERERERKRETGR